MAMRASRTPFIRRPIGTTLLAIGLFLVGVVAYRFLPVAQPADRRVSDHPRHRQPARRRSRDHGGDGGGAARAAARRDRRRHRDDLAQFARHHPHLGAVRPRAATSTAPRATCRPRSTRRSPICRPTCRRCRRFRKANPAAAPVLILALTSKTVPPSAHLRRRRYGHRAAHCRRSTASPRSRVNGAEQPAIRVRVNPLRARLDGPRHRGGAHRHRQRQRRRPARHRSTATSRRSPSRSTTSSAPPRTTTRSWCAPPTATVVRLSAVAVDRAERAQQPLGRLVQRPARRCCW